MIPLAFMNIDYNNLNVNTQMLLNLTTSLLIVITIFIVYRKYLIEKFIDFKKNLPEYFDTGFKIWFIGLIGMCAANILIATLSPVKEATNETLVQEMLKQTPLLSFISAAFIAPFLEEMLFRKSFGDIFKNKKIMFVASGILFGVLHVIFSYNVIWDFLYIIPYGFLGGAFAYQLYKTDNIYIPISFHIIHNGILTLISILSLLVTK